LEASYQAMFFSSKCVLITFHINFYKIVNIGQKNLTKWAFYVRIKGANCLNFLYGLF
jgi:hypothetical protein